MKSWFFIGIVCAFSGSLFAQVDYDFLHRNSFSIIKQSQNLAGNKPKKAYQLRTCQEVETHCGTGYVKKKVHGELTDTDFTEYTYADGLTLQIPEDENGHLWFTITGESYGMILDNGTIVHVGMKAEELQTIFPKSYSKRKSIEMPIGKKGKISFIVFLAITIEDQTRIVEERINFFVNPDSGLLEEFYYYEPL